MKKAMSIGKGIAIAGIWIGVGLSALGGGSFVGIVALLAFFTTVAIS